MVRKIDYIERIDRYVGQRIYELRLMLGMCRQELAVAIGVTHQQLQKYEKGINRISAGRLFTIAGVLKKPVSYFFEQTEAQDGGNSFNASNQRKCMEVSRNFMRIKNEDYQNAVNLLIRKLAGADAVSDSSEEVDNII